MTCDEFYKAVQEAGDIPSQEKTRQYCKAFVDTVKDCVKSGDSISIPRFGKFESKDIPERVSHGFGKDVVVPAHKKPKFRASAKFLED